MRSGGSFTQPSDGAQSDPRQARAPPGARSSVAAGDKVSAAGESALGLSPLAARELGVLAVIRDFVSVLCDINSVLCI